MAALRGFLSGDDRQNVTRNGHRYVSATLATWDGKVNVTLRPDGDARVTVENDRHGPREVWTGNVDQHTPEGDYSPQEWLAQTRLQLQRVLDSGQLDAQLADECRVMLGQDDDGPGGQA